jgi:hypothetical protein
MKGNILSLLLCILILSASTVFAQDYCNGNFDCDEDVDGSDAAVFKSDFGRSGFKNPCPGCPPRAPVQKTGQTTSYATGDDGDLEKGVGWPEPRFRDDLNGKDANCFGTRTWNNALVDCNGLSSGWCGLTDGSSAGAWRLPNIRELLSLVDYSQTFYPVLPDGHPFTSVSPNFYWSSTSDESFYPSFDARIVIMSSGISITELKTNSDVHHVWCVRGGQ